MIENSDSEQVERLNSRVIELLRERDALVKALEQIEQLSDRLINLEEYTVLDAFNDLSSIRSVIKGLHADVGGSR